VNPWEIWTWQGHPAVIVSGPARCAHKPIVNILSCSSHRGIRKPELWEVVLDRADGLDWETLCRCDLLYAVHRQELTERRGLVGFERRERRRSIIRVIVSTFNWGL